MHNLNINHDKSLALLEVLNWQTVYAGDGMCIVTKYLGTIGVTTAYWTDDNSVHVDLYEPTNMALAWQAMTMLCELPEVAAVKSWWKNQEWFNIAQPRDVQALWLDTMLEHLVDVGMMSAELLVVTNH